MIIKKLGYDTESETLDKNICRVASAETECDVREAVQQIVERMRDTETDSGNVLNLENIQDLFKDLNHS